MSRKRQSRNVEHRAGHSSGRQNRKNRAGQQRTAGAASKGRRKNKTFDIVSTIILLAAVCVFVFSAYKLVMTLVPYYVGGKEYDEIRDLAITADENGEGFSVDFDALLKENPDTVAWIRFEEPSVISYPVVKSKDNEEYLTKTFTANDNKLGAIFMDMNCNSGFTDRNTFIYGHHLNSGGEMFSQLDEYADESFCKEHPYFYIYTPDGREITYHIYSVGQVEDTSDTYLTSFASDEDYQAFLDMTKEISLYDTGVEVTTEDTIVTLSTCTSASDEHRFVVRGVKESEVNLNQ